MILYLVVTVNVHILHHVVDKQQRQFIKKARKGLWHNKRAAVFKSQPLCISC